MFFFNSLLTEMNHLGVILYCYWVSPHACSNCKCSKAKHLSLSSRQVRQHESCLAHRAETAKPIFLFYMYEFGRYFFPRPKRQRTQKHKGVVLFEDSKIAINNYEWNNNKVILFHYSFTTYSVVLESLTLTNLYFRENQVDQRVQRIWIKR